MIFLIKTKGPFDKFSMFTSSFILHNIMSTVGETIYLFIFL